VISRVCRRLMGMQFQVKYAILLYMRDAFKTFNSGRANFFLMAFISCIIAGVVLKLMSSVVLPFTIALLLAMVMYPVVLGLDKLRIPRFCSIFLAIVLIIAGLYFFGMVFFTSGRTIVSLYPKYESRLTEIYLWASRFFELSYDEDLTFLQNLWGQLGIRNMIRTFTFSFSNFFLRFLQNAILVVLFMGFLLVEANHFKEKLELAFGQRSDQIKNMGDDIILQVTRYLTAKFFISLITGVVVSLGLRMVGLEFALGWGVIQFVLNFIPSLGSIAAGIAVSLFALIQFWPDPGPVILVIIIMLATNMIIGNVLDPKIIGDNVGISPLVVLVSLAIWGWLWGFIGMILAVPMMVSIKIICENFSFLEPISILLGSRKAVNAKKTSGQ
jgi:predicted PurR-regulated permease PerM